MIPDKTFIFDEITGALTPDVLCEIAACVNESRFQAARDAFIVALLEEDEDDES